MKRLLASAAGSVAETPVPDLGLVRAAQAGDRTAFAELVRRYQNAVAGMAYALTGRFGLAEDVAQETFLIAWRRLSEIKQPERFEGWLLGVARRASLRALRDQRPKQVETGLPPAFDQMPSSDPSPLERAIDHQEEDFLWRALKRIPESYRVPLVLFYREQQSTEKVARLLDLSETNVRQRLWQGRRMLHENVIEEVESSLGRTRTGERFTALVLAALAAAHPETAAAATRSVAAARRASAALPRAAAALGLTLTVAGAVQIGRAVRGRSEPLDRAALVAAAPAAAPTRLQPRAARLVSAPGTSPGMTAASVMGREAPPVFAFDFEDGLLPESFRMGHVVPGPPHSGNRHAIQGTIDARRDFMSSTTAVVFATPSLTYRPSLVLVFDYWATNDDGLQVSIRNSAAKSLYMRRLTGLVHGRWARARFLLRNLAPTSAGKPMEPGDDITNLEIASGYLGDSPVIVDNIRLVDDPREDLASFKDSLDLL